MSYAVTSVNGWLAEEKNGLMLMVLAWTVVHGKNLNLITWIEQQKLLIRYGLGVRKDAKRNSLSV
jgi:hypothetical protein